MKVFCLFWKGSLKLETVNSRHKVFRALCNETTTLRSLTVISDVEQFSETKHSFGGSGQTMNAKLKLHNANLSRLVPTCIWDRPQPDTFCAFPLVWSFQWAHHFLLEQDVEKTEYLRNWTVLPWTGHHLVSRPKIGHVGQPSSTLKSQNHGYDRQNGVIASDKKLSKIVLRGYR